MIKNGFNHDLGKQTLVHTETWTGGTFWRYFKARRCNHALLLFVIPSSEAEQLEENRSFRSRCHVATHAFFYRTSTCRNSMTDDKQAHRSPSFDRTLARTAVDVPSRTPLGTQLIPRRFPQGPAAEHFISFRIAEIRPLETSGRGHMLGCEMPR